MFGDVIRSFRNNNGLSQTQFVDIIQRSSESCNNLDVVTLSRWERGVTQPHLSRQNELLSLIGVNILDIWSDSSIEKSLQSIIKKINVDGYIATDAKPEINIVRINRNNSFIINNFIKELELIFHSERNFLFESCHDKGLDIKGMFEKLINQYLGELTLVFVHSHLIGHLFTIDASSIEDFPDLLQDVPEKNSHLIMSLNFSHVSAVIPTIGREVYKYLQNLNPKTQLHVYINNKRMFDILFSLSFEYKTITYNDDVAKIMSLDHKKIKSKRVWMDILSNYKGSVEW